MSFSTAGWAVAIGMTLVLPVSYAIHCLSLPAPSAAQMVANAKLLAATPLWLLALKSLLLYPVVEECIYRGIILQLLRRYLPPWGALMPPTLLFGVTHLGASAQNAVFAALVGLCFAWLAIRSGSLIPSILCHSAINLFVVFILPLVVDRQAATRPDFVTQPWPLFLLAVSAVVLATGIWKLRGEFRRPMVSVPTTAAA